MSTYSIGEMAKKLSKSVKTLQNWDKNGTLVTLRTPSNRRYYTHEQYLKASGKEKYISDGNDALSSLSGKSILITGGTGSLGNAIVERIADSANKIVVYSRCELKQAKMKQKFADKNNIRYIIGDIKDKNRLLAALKNIDICIHAACMKRVETCTYNPIEAVKNNVIGSVNVVEACIESSVKKSLLVSTDKACCPSTLYGGTKFVAEQIFINGNNHSTRDGTKFLATRYGNVYASNGSVKHIFEQQAKSGKLKVTHENMTRFFMSMDEAVDLNLYAIVNGIGGEIFIPKLKATGILRYAKLFAPGVPIEFIGLRGYEKIHEELISRTEIMYTVDCGKYYKIVPPSIAEPLVGWDYQYPEENIVKEFTYSSDMVEQFTDEELLGLEE